MTHTGGRAAWAATQVPVTFVAFDLLHIHGQDLTGLPLLERKRHLDDLHLMGPAWITNGWVSGRRRHLVPAPFQPRSVAEEAEDCSSRLG
jgi:bifunctional non-homologous end joining protein LigD